MKTYASIYCSGTRATEVVVPGWVDRVVGNACVAHYLDGQWKS